MPSNGIRSLNVNPERGPRANAPDNDAPPNLTDFPDTWYASALTLVLETRTCAHCGHQHAPVASGPYVRMDCVQNPHRSRLVIPANAPTGTDTQTLPRTHTHQRTSTPRCEECFKPSTDIPAPVRPSWKSILARRLGRTEEPAPQRPVTATKLSEFL